MEVLLMIVLGLAPHGDSAVINGGFEQIDQLTGMPSGWSFTSLPGQTRVCYGTESINTDGEENHALVISIAADHSAERVACNAHQDLKELAARTTPVLASNANTNKTAVGGMSFSGDTIRLTQSDNGTLECQIEGRARLTLGDERDTDFTIAAQKMTISRKANSGITVRCTGDCLMSDIELTCSADRMQIQLARQVKLQMSGRSRVEYGDGDNRTTFAAESIWFEGGTFHLSGAASLKHGP